MQSIISDNERKELLDLAKKTAGNHQIVSCCIYGSKVAGYARPDSDYDLILVLKDYNDLIEYIYYHGDRGLDASILVVDSDILLKDATKAALGEFVVGRLLHPYEPLINDEYLKEVEIAYKKRVILEAIRELAKTPFYKEFIIPIRYFLLAKIKERSKIYPHALYSYIKTYTNQFSKKNLEFTLNGFRSALKLLEEEGYIKFYDKDSIIILADIKYKRNNIANIINGILAYMVHFYAGRSTLNFFRQEAKSKLKRRKEIRELDKEFLEPERVLKIRDAILLHEEDWLDELLTYMNVRDHNITITKLGDIHATTTLYKINDNLRLVAKHYASIKRFKWIGLNAWMIGLVKFDTDPSQRQLNEYKALRILKELGFNVPTIIGLSYKYKTTITKYIEGITLDKIINDILNNKSRDASKIKEFGKLLYSIHNHGYMIKDTKANNVIIHDNKLYLTDLEQFKKDNDYAWDIICFIYYSIKFTSNEDTARLIVKAFLDGYTNDNAINCKHLIKQALSKKYLPPFYPALVINTVKAVWKEMHNYL
ncbi:MAG: hypothetical protein KatS3mg003_0854 [Candidatus Nitrosocaldaceae archaeon]|nr:MAG: hypothetical protein KatS3mg003_0854 [Candidatus Nitrosocaldaceae archaeon]